MIQNQSPETIEPVGPAGSARLTMDSPAIYSIQVRGDLDSSWSEKLGGLKVEAKAGSGVTLLNGTLPDQAALSGVLNTLYDLQLPVISVEHLPQTF